LPQRDGELDTNQLPNGIPHQTDSEARLGSQPAPAAICVECHRREARQGDLCGSCAATKPFRFARKYTITPEILEELRLAYMGGRTEVSAKLRRLSIRTKIPTYRLSEEANSHGWYCCAPRRGWSAEEDSYLRERLGAASLDSIARRLKRSLRSVEARARRFKLSVRISEGYNMRDLAQVFGVHRAAVKRWMERGLFGKFHEHGQEIRVTEVNVVRFIRRYPQEYSLGRVDQTWFKAMVFGQLAELGDGV
jgi:hypothetical protein